MTSHWYKMSRDISLFFSLIVVLLVVASIKIFSPTLDEPDLDIALEFKRILASSIEIESEICEEYQASTIENMIQSYAKIFKNVICKRYSNSVIKVRDEFINETRSLINNYRGNRFGNYIDKMMKFGDFDPSLKIIARQYQTQLERGAITGEDITCNMVRFQITNLHAIMFVLQTDIKYLLMVEDHVKLDEAIEGEIKSRSASTLDEKFNDDCNLTSIPYDLIERFYLQNQGGELEWYSAIGRFREIGRYTIEKLVESCRGIMDYRNQLIDLESGHSNACTKSRMNQNSDFSRVYKFDQYDLVFNFCRNIMNTFSC